MSATSWWTIGEPYTVLSFTENGFAGDPKDFDPRADFVDGDQRVIYYASENRTIHQVFEGPTDCGGWVDQDE